jgi:hypothetical protein
MRVLSNFWDDEHLAGKLAARKLLDGVEEP